MQQAQQMQMAEKLGPQAMKSGTDLIKQQSEE